MKQYVVTGMSCAACSARVEKAVSKVEGVTSCSVSLLTNSMGVEARLSLKILSRQWKRRDTALLSKTDPGRRRTVRREALRKICWQIGKRPF